MWRPEVRRTGFYDPNEALATQGPVLLLRVQILVCRCGNFRVNEKMKGSDFPMGSGAHHKLPNTTVWAAPGVQTWTEVL